MNGKKCTKSKSGVALLCKVAQKQGTLPIKVTWTDHYPAMISALLMIRAAPVMQTLVRLLSRIVPLFAYLDNLLLPPYLGVFSDVF